MKEPKFRLKNYFLTYSKLKFGAYDLRNIPFVSVSYNFPLVESNSTVHSEDSPGSPFSSLDQCLTILRQKCLEMRSHENYVIFHGN